MFIKPGFESSSLQFQHLDVPLPPTPTHTHTAEKVLSPAGSKRCSSILIAYNICSLHIPRITHLSNMWREGVAFFSAAEDMILGKSHYDK